LEEEIVQKIPIKFTGSLGNILKIYTPNNLGNLEVLDTFPHMYDIQK
jgi:hypothetical protein